MCINFFESRYWGDKFNLSRQIFDQKEDSTGSYYIFSWHYDTMRVVIKFTTPWTYI